MIILLVRGSRSKNIFYDLKRSDGGPTADIFIANFLVFLFSSSSWEVKSIVWEARAVTKKTIFLFSPIIKVLKRGALKKHQVNFRTEQNQLDVTIDFETQ